MNKFPPLSRPPRTTQAAPVGPVLLGRPADFRPIVYRSSTTAGLNLTYQYFAFPSSSGSAGSSILRTGFQASWRNVCLLATGERFASDVVGVEVSGLECRGNSAGGDGGCGALDVASGACCCARSLLISGD